ncbi:MAG: carboxypeptidase-like regulatory domain-containing protein, partial [Armatimonadota bacterium]
MTAVRSPGYGGIMMRWLRMVVFAALAACCVPAQALPVTITGSVVGPEGPIAGARVEAFSTGWELSADGWGGTETDAEGAFTLITGDRAAGLVVSALGCETKIITPLPRESASVRLRPGGRSLRGRVTDRGHGPVRDVRVRIVQLDPSGDDRPVFMSMRHPVTALQALTDGEGRFEIAGLPECEELMIVAGRRSFSTVSEKLPGIPDEPVELLVAPEAVVHGRVTWDGRPVRDVQVSVYGHIWSDTTDHDGRFRLEALPGGPLKLHVRPPSGLHAWEPERIFLTAGETREVNIHVARPAAVSGMVARVGTGDPVGDAYVVAECEGGEWAEAVADEEGRYELVVPPGRVIVRFAGLREGGPQFTGRERHLDVPEVSLLVEAEQSIADVDLQ